MEQPLQFQRERKLTGAGHSEIDWHSLFESHCRVCADFFYFYLRTVGSLLGHNPTVGTARLILFYVSAMIETRLAGFDADSPLFEDSARAISRVAASHDQRAALNQLQQRILNETSEPSLMQFLDEILATLQRYPRPALPERPPMPPQVVGLLPPANNGDGFSDMSSGAGSGSRDNGGSRGSGTDVSGTNASNATSSIAAGEGRIAAIRALVDLGQHPAQGGGAADRVPQQQEP